MLRQPTESLPQRVLVTLMADYKDTIQHSVPASVLTAVLLDFDITPEAARTALSRLGKKGILERTKSGRSAAYSLSDDALKMVDEDMTRIFTFGEQNSWDGHWTLVAFSIAERDRAKRYVLRTQLRALGFAPLYDGVWGCAHATVDQAQAALADAGVDDALVIRGDIAGDVSSIMSQFKQSWQLDEVATKYQDFILSVTPLVERARSGRVAPAEALVARTRVMDAWRVFPRIDPDLPELLLPAEWPRAQARTCFMEAWTLLRDAAELRLKVLVEDTGR
ncbi:PaaX family transcriptional regulator C-terminal domain-containing protein [Arthrobacter sp. 18067]|uniref:PaaX family transcriptional regulator n=1 Tax=Arthrobacter sp. 18067 TaxID=2681413 RepID=UPI00135C2240|nr:PaaX family transcriptional regulator C-terminal domain-containing protein [Arthrobacter sp. 18067]